MEQSNADKRRLDRERCLGTSIASLKVLCHNNNYYYYYCQTAKFYVRIIIIIIIVVCLLDRMVGRLSWLVAVSSSS